MCVNSHSWVFQSGATERTDAVLDVSELPTVSNSSPEKETECFSAICSVLCERDVIMEGQ